MENSSECVEAKTPRRTRRSSVTEHESVSKKTRSTKKIKLPEIEEREDVAAASDPKTPSRSVKKIEFQTPNKSEATTLTQTPRRSARKSIKPVQEYESIVAQKGVKRAVESTLDDEDPTMEGKWIPAVIGRASTKRHKKAGRGKGKNLKRQRRCTDDSEDNDDEEKQDCDMEAESVEVLRKETDAIVEEPATEKETLGQDSDSKQIAPRNDLLLVEKRIDTENLIVKDTGVETKTITVDKVTAEENVEACEGLERSEKIAEAKQGRSIKETLMEDVVEGTDVKETTEETSGDVKETTESEDVGGRADVKKATESEKEKPLKETSTEDVVESTGVKESTESVGVEDSTDVKETAEPKKELATKEAMIEDVVKKTAEEIPTEIGVEKKIEDTPQPDDIPVDGEDSVKSPAKSAPKVGAERGNKEKSAPEVIAGRENREVNSREEKESVSLQTTVDTDAQQADKQKDVENTVEPDEESVSSATTGDAESKQANSQKDVENTVESEQNSDSDSSMDYGDVELNGMPVTADDCMDSPQKEITSSLSDASNLKSLNVSGVENADDSDCIMLSLDESSNTVKSENLADESSKSNRLLNESTASSDMPSLMVCSDDEDTVPVKAEADIKSEQVESAAEAEESSKLNSTFDADQTPAKPAPVEEQHTPALRSSINHVPTPFKSKTPIIPDIVIEPEEDLEAENVPMFVEEPRETRMKSVRKRSFSVSGDRPKRNVTFFSPANTTISIYDGDLLHCRKPESSEKPSHRKRSLSVTETEQEMFAYIKEQKVPDTPDSKKKSSRIKMPNFSAIHQQQFKKMESISDHVARKAERAKILSNSALKAKPASVQKGLPVKNCILRDSNKESKSNLQMPKARQRIELSGIEHKSKPEQTGWLNVGMKMRTKSRNDLSALDYLPSIDKLYKFNTNNLVFSGNTKPKLPKPRMDTTVTSANKPNPLLSKTTTAVTEDKPDSRPKFNLSTAPDCQSFRSTETLNDRRKRLMDMYKSRNHPRAGEKNREILKGVRTNRRFELQMMCRNRPN